MRAVDPRLLKASPGARRYLISCGPLGLITAGAIIAQAAALASAVSGVLLDGDGLGDVVPALIVLSVASVVRGGAAWAFEAGGHLAASTAASDLRRRLVGAILRGDVLHEDEGRGRLATAATSGIDALDPYFARYVPALVLSKVVPVVILVAVATLDVTSALLMALTLPLIPVFGILVGRMTERRARAKYAMLGRLSSHFLDVVSGLATLRAFNRGAAQAERIAETGEAYRRETMGMLRIAFLSALVLEWAAVLATALVAVEIGVRLDNGDIALAPALTILVLAPELYTPLRTAAAQFHASADGMAAADVILDRIDSTDARRVGGARPLDPRDVPIRLEGVTVRYAGREAASLDAVDLMLWPGERVALVGQSGAGKSTLAAVLLGFATPDDGRVRVGDRGLAETDLDAWRMLTAWMPQHPRVTPGTLLDAVRLGAPFATQADADEAAQRAGLRGLIAELPHGWRTRVGEAARQFSAGEVRRIALARALVRDASLLILDEPTASLDADRALAVGSALDRLPRGATTLLVTHDGELARRWADRVVRLESGRIVVAESERPA
jgi:thiol reductant ABC exporter CydD subunit